MFSGGSLLYGSVGRTDLLGDHRTDDLTRKQFRSARKLASTLPDDAPLYPTHGFGSFCSSGGASGGTDSTIGTEKMRNDALLEDDEQRFADRLVAGLTGYPAYYVHMGPLNALGPDAPDLTPARSVDPAELAARIRTGEWVVDLRDRSAYAGRHLAGTVSIMIGKQFSTYAGWVIPWGAPITLIAEDPEQIAEAQRQLVRIGIDHLAGSATGPLDGLAPGVPVRSYATSTFQDVADADDATVLDVRREDEVKDGRIDGSVHIPLHGLPGRPAPRRAAGQGVGARRERVPGQHRGQHPGPRRARRRPHRRRVRQRREGRPAYGARRLNCRPPRPDTDGGPADVPGGALRDLRQDDLGRLRQPRRSGDGVGARRAAVHLRRPSRRAGRDRPRSAAASNARPALTPAPRQAGPPPARPRTA